MGMTSIAKRVRRRMNKFTGKRRRNSYHGIKGR